MAEQRRTGIYLLLITSILLIIVGGTLLYIAYQQPLSIDVDGKIFRVRGHFETIAQAVESAGVELRDEDFVWPSSGSAPSSTDSITVRSASSVELSIDGQTKTCWTLQDNLASFLAEQDVRLGLAARVSVDGRGVPWPAPVADLAQEAIGRSVSVDTLAEVVIRDGQSETKLVTGASSVGEALIEAGKDVYGADDVEPALASRLVSDATIVIERAMPVIVQLDGGEIAARSSSPDVASVLAELGIGLIGGDQTSQGLGRPMDGDSPISIERAITSYEVMETPLAYSSQLLPLDSLEIDQRALVSAGSPGSVSELKRIDLIGSQTISPTVVGRWTSVPASDEVVGYGTNVVVRSLDTPEGQISYWRVVRMRVTAYTAADAGKPRDHPAYGITASGRPAGFGVVAIDPKVVPFRSQVYVPGYGIAFAGDTGGGVKGRWIDLGYDEGEIVAWNGYVDVYYLTPVPDPGRINYLIPTTLP